MLKGEQGYLETLKELVDKAESKGFRDVRDGHKRCSLFGRQLRFNLEESFPLMSLNPLSTGKSVQTMQSCL